MEYIKQLDSIRAIAVILVIISHWFPESHILNHIPIGAIGVDLFFVLSGFLITTILFQNKNIKNVSKGRILKVFYIRRILRIFPIYYLTIFILLLFHSYTNTAIKEDFFYYLTYTSNFNFIIKWQWDGMLSHLWTLSVEEQFYLIWPWLIIFTKKKHLIHVISLFIVIGLCSRFTFTELPFMRLLTTSCFDSFGIGALLSWIITYKKNLLNKFYSFNRAFSFVLFALIIFGNIAYSTHYLTIIPENTANSIISIWLITYIYLNKDSKKSVFRFFLNKPVLIFIGKISYGIYLYHLILPKFSYSFLISHIMEVHPRIYHIFNLPYTIILFNFILLIIISWGSFKIIEMPFLKMKKKYSL